jgi:hypothetical protein
MNYTASGIRDNHTRGSVAEFLQSHIHPGTRLSFVSAYFTINAYYALRAQFDQIEHLDFLFGEPAFINKLDPEQREAKAFALVDDLGCVLLVHQRPHSHHIPGQDSIDGLGDFVVVVEQHIFA